MRFWDSSAIVPLLFDEARSDAIQALLDQDDLIAVAWLTDIECTSAIARREREKQLPREMIATATKLLADLAARFHEVEPTQELRETAKRLVRLHPLTASDATQLAAALTLAENDPTSLTFVALDQRLRAAASQQGFSVLP